MFIYVAEEIIWGNPEKRKKLNFFLNLRKKKQKKKFEIFQKFKYKKSNSKLIV